MAVTWTWIISSLVLLICGFTIAGGQVIYCNGNNTWSESSKLCQLASEEDINEINNANVGWAGGVYRTTSWMSYEGCYYNPGNGINRQIFPDNSPPKCSVLCDKYKFFGLMENVCICIEGSGFSISQDNTRCSETCPGLNTTNCGSTSNNYADLYRHLKTDINIRNNTDPSFHCLAVKNKNNTLKLKAVSCSKNVTPLCVDRSTKKILRRVHNAITNQEIPFKKAKEHCTLYDNTSIITSIPQLTTYWTAYHRYEYLYWLNDDNDTVIHQGERHWKTKCLAIQKSKESFTRLARKCSDKLPCFCSDRNMSSLEIDRNIYQNEGQSIDNVSTITEAIVTLDQTTTVYTEVIHETTTVYSIPGSNGSEVINEANTVNATPGNIVTVPHTNVFAIQIVFVVCLSISVVFVAALSWLMYRQKSGSARLWLPASPKLERNYFNDVNDFGITTPPTNSTNEYSSAWDIYHHTR